MALRPEATAAPVAVGPVPCGPRSGCPALIAEVSGAIGLTEAVDGLLGDLPSSCLVAYQGGREIVARRSDLALVPASTQKILVGSPPSPGWARLPLHHQGGGRRPRR